MNLVEALIVVLIVILIVCCLRHKHARQYIPKASRSPEREPHIVAKKSDVRVVSSPEADSLRSNNEYFSANGDTSNCDDKFSYAVNEFGAPNMTYNDWIADQSIDATTKANHKSFVSDQMNSTNNVTGKTYAIGEIEDDSGIVWQGIRGRPQDIPDSAKAGSLQVADIREGALSKKPRFSWNS